MPMVRRCKADGCRSLTERPAHYCTIHKSMEAQERQRYSRTRYNKRVRNRDDETMHSIGQGRGLLFGRQHQSVTTICVSTAQRQMQSHQTHVQVTTSHLLRQHQSLELKFQTQQQRVEAAITPRGLQNKKSMVLVKTERNRTLTYDFQWQRGRV